MKTANEIMEEHNFFCELEMMEIIESMMKSYAIQAIDRCAEVGYNKSDDRVKYGILEIKKELE